MRIFQTSTLRDNEFDELILGEPGAFKTIDSVIYLIFLTCEEYAKPSIERYVREAIQNGIKVYSGLTGTGKLEIVGDRIINNTQYRVEFVAHLDMPNKVKLLNDLMLGFASDNRELLTQVHE